MQIKPVNAVLSLLLAHVARLAVEHPTCWYLRITHHFGALLPVNRGRCHSRSESA